MKTVTLIVSAMALAAMAAAPAAAAGKHKRLARHAAVQEKVAVTSGFQGGVLKGPLYNGQDYIGDDPDPNIRARLIRDQTRYQGSY